MLRGGEMQVLYGSFETLKRCKPFIVFEHGLGASEYYGTKPEQVFDFLNSCGLKVSLMKRWLKGCPELSRNEFVEQYDMRYNYYFIAYPDSN